MKVSVLIPTYNREAFLEAAIASVRAQNVRDYEIVIWDDGSTDSTPDVIRGLEDVRYVLAPHKGVAHARNQLVQLAQGEFIAFLDADDLWHPEKLARQLAYLEQHPESLLVASEAETFLDDSVDAPSERQRELLSADYDTLLPTTLIRREAFERFGLFNESLPTGEDTEWLVRLSVAGIRINERLPEKLYRYRIHDHNTMIDANQTIREYLKMIARAARLSRKKTVEGYSADVLSVIIPAYNAERYLAEAVASVRAQELPADIRHVELIVVDDGSTDGTLELARSLDADLVLSESHRNTASARNLGVRNATGDLIMFLDADDVLRQGAFEAVCTPLLEDPSLMACFGRLEDFLSPELEPAQVADVVLRAEPYGGVIPGAACFRRAVFAPGMLGPFDENLPHGESISWLLRFRDLGILSLNVETVLAGRRIHLSNTGRLEKEKEHRNYAAILRARLKKRG